MKKILTLAIRLTSVLTLRAAEKPNILWIVTDDQRADSIASKTDCPIKA